MSLIASSWAWKQRVPTPSLKLLLMAFADQARECGHVWPSLRTVSDRVGIEVRQVQKNIVTLEELNLVEKIEQFREDGGSAANLFRMSFDPEPCQPECRGYDPVVLGNKGGVSSGTGGGSSSGTGPSLRTVTKNHKVNGWAITETEDDAFAWAIPLQDMNLVHRDPPEDDWLQDVKGIYPESWMRIEARKFVDYYNAPDTRKLKGWKTAFRTWVGRAGRDGEWQFEQGDRDTDSDMLHDTSLPKGECRCRMCLRRAKTG